MTKKMKNSNSSKEMAKVKQLVKIEYIHKGVLYYDMTEECSKAFMEAYRNRNFENWFDVFGYHTSISELEKEPNKDNPFDEFFEEDDDFNFLSGNNGYTIEVISAKSEFEKEDGIDCVEMWHGTPKWKGERKNGKRFGKWLMYRYDDNEFSNPIYSLVYNEKGEIIEELKSLQTNKFF